MHKITLSNDDLISIFNLENRNLAHVVLDYLDYNEVELTNEYELHYYFKQTYIQSIPKPLSKEETQALVLDIIEGNTKFVRYYYQGNNYAIRPSEELLDYMEEE